MKRYENAMVDTSKPRKRGFSANSAGRPKPLYQSVYQNSEYATNI